MIKAYSQIEFKYLTSSPFCYVRNDDALFKTPYFEIRHEGLKMQGIYLTKEDFPIQIRSYKASDKIELKNGTSLKCLISSENIILLLSVRMESLL